MLGLPHKQVIQCVVVSDDGDTVSTTSDAGAAPSLLPESRRLWLHASVSIVPVT